MQAAAGDSLLPEQVKDLVATGRQQSGLVRRRAFRGVLAAELSAAYGEAELAMKGLENADSAGLFDIHWVDRCPLLRPLEKDPRFVAIRARVAERAREVREALGVATEGPSRLAS
jgi:hypothetical protein